MKKSFFLTLLIPLLTLQLCIGQISGSKNIFWFKSVHAGDSVSLFVQNADTASYQLMLNNQYLNSLQVNSKKGKAVNFNPAFVLNSAAISHLHIPVKLKGKNAKTMIVVFKVNDTINENAIWTYRLNDKKYIGLTSQELVTLNHSHKYTDTNMLKPFINTIVFYTNNVITDTNSGLTLGKTDSLLFDGCIAEALLFNKHLKGNELTKWQTYLAVKYGIKLIETNYLNSSDTIIWEYTSDYNGAIAGIGYDSLFGLNQKQSFSTSEEDIITLGAGAIDSTNDANPYTLGQNQSIIWAHNELPVEIVNDTINIRQDNEDYMYFSRLQREWLLQVTGQNTAAVSVQLIFDGAGLHVAPGDEFYLLIDRSASGDFSPSNAELIEPDSITPNGLVVFNDLNWDTDSSGKDLFTFSFVKNFNSESRNEELLSDNSTQSNSQNGEGFMKASSTGGIVYSLYPNPTQGAYRLEIKTETETFCNIRLLDVSGRELKNFNNPSLTQLILDDVLPGKGIYVIEIQTLMDIKIFKIVMR